MKQHKKQLMFVNSYSNGLLSPQLQLKINDNVTNNLTNLRGLCGTRKRRREQRWCRHRPVTSKHQAFVHWDHSAKWGQPDFPLGSTFRSSLWRFAKTMFSAALADTKRKRAAHSCFRLGAILCDMESASGRFSSSPLAKHRLWNMSIMRLSFIAVWKQNRGNHNTNKCHSQS